MNKAVARHREYGPSIRHACLTGANAHLRTVAGRASVVSLLILMLVASSAVSGNLSNGLTRTISGKQANEPIAVWIHLPRPEPLLKLKQSIAAASVSPSERHRVALARLQSQHSQAQRAVVQELNNLQQRGWAFGIKQHWIANIVEARVFAGELATLAARSDIDIIYQQPVLTTIVPDAQRGSTSLSTSVGANLQFVNADQAWAAGFTGAGRLVCSFDTGIDGVHPALAGSWKGNDGDSSAAWFDPVGMQTFPHTLSGPSVNHGTHVMGTMVGRDTATGDTVGIAPGAMWISAAVIDIQGSSIIDAFEWVADPDGDPNSVDDLPDVINHSWGVRDIGCSNAFYDLIDNIEALGIVNVFASGNEGPAASTIRNPSNRANTNIDCFAVGNVNSSSTPPPLSSNSSRGPSDCNGAIKPNVTAPGTSIRSSIPGNGYGFMSGTSMSSPHVSGLVALLRQKNPNATVDEVKTAILNSTQTYGLTLPDNNYGYGVIDCMAALNALSAVNAQPNVRVYGFDHAVIAAGDTVQGTVVLQNRGAAVSSVSGTISSSDPSLTVLNGSAFFGNMAEGDTLRSNDIVSVIVSDTVTDGSILSLDFAITGSPAYSATAKLLFLVEPRSVRSFVSHQANRISTTVSSFGTYGLGTNSFFPAGGLGFQFDGGANDLYECGLLVATDQTHVSDGIRNSIGEPDGDFAVAPGGNIVLVTPGAKATEETDSRFTDARSENPIGVDITQRTFAFASAPDDDYIIMQFIIENNTGGSLSSLLFGMYLDWDIQVFNSNAGGYESATEIAWTAYNDGLQTRSYRGVTALDGSFSSAATHLGNIAYFPEGLTEAEKYASMIGGNANSDIYKTSRTDLIQIVAVGPLSLAPNAVDTVTVALVAGSTLTNLMTAKLNALQQYENSILACCVGTRGDVDFDGLSVPDIVDLTAIVDYLFGIPPDIICPEEADINGDSASGGLPDIVDLTFIVDYLFGLPPPLVSCP